MNKILAVLLALSLGSAQAEITDREVLGAVVGAVIGYQIARSLEPQPPVALPQPVYMDPRTHRMEDIRRPQPHNPRCWNRLDRINQYGQPIYMQECL